MIELDIKFGRKPNEYNPLVAAYLGDTLYDLYVRSRLIADEAAMNVNKLHTAATKFVSAHGQSEAIGKLEPILSESELAAYKHGRNAKSYTVPKNADVGEYRRATGFEALLGTLYMSGESERLEELMELAYETIINALEVK